MNAVTQHVAEPASRAVTRSAGQATLVEQSRAIAEVQAAVVVAQNRPRSASAAMHEMREVCRIPALADRAFFRFNRGGVVTGETVHLARELARIWGNVTFGIAEMSRDDIKQQSEMLAFAWDLQTNARSQTTFIVPHIRDTKQGPKPMTDMRDIYENNANMGARRLREMIFAVLPVWFREEAADICRQTLEDGGGKPLVQRIADCVAALEAIGITRAQIQAKVGCPVDNMLAEHVAQLGVVYKSIKRGEVQKDEEFPNERPTQVGSKLDALEKAAIPLHDALEGDSIPALDEAKPETTATEVAPSAPEDKILASARRLIGRFIAAKDIDAYNDILLDQAIIEGRKRIAAKRPELEAEIEAARASSLHRISSHEAA